MATLRSFVETLIYIGFLLADILYQRQRHVLIKCINKQNLKS